MSQKEEKPEYEGGDGEPEFDDWFNDPESENTTLENQAAAFRAEDAVYDVDPRTLMEGDALKGLPTRFAGQCFFKFQNGDGKHTIQKGSGHIVKDLGGGKYVMLTAQHIARGVGEFKSGYFFLQRTDSTKYAARFTMSGPDDVVHHRDFPNANKLSGSNISAVRITLNSGEMPAGLPELQTHILSDINRDDSMQITISGYPQQKWEGGKFIDSKFAMYSTNSTPDIGMGPSLESEQGFGGVVGFSMDTSKGQEGGALVDTETGVVIGILFGVGELESDMFSVATVITDQSLEWINGCFA